MGEIVEFTPPGDEQGAEGSKGEVHNFDFAVVPGHVYDKDSNCPHCQTMAKAEWNQEVFTPDNQLVADLMLCTDCNQTYLVVERPPMLKVKQPVMTHWKYFEPLVGDLKTKTDSKR